MRKGVLKRPIHHEVGIADKNFSATYNLIVVNKKGGEHHERTETVPVLRCRGYAHAAI